MMRSQLYIFAILTLSNFIGGPTQAEAQSRERTCYVAVKNLAIDRLINCDDKWTSVECSIFCMKGMVFQYNPAPVYTCLYVKGEFSPQPIPKCIKVAKCDGGRIFKPCGPPHQPVCGDAIEGNNIDKERCVDGCFCPDGKVWHENQCITRDKCPCKLNGENFASGSTISKDCNTCTCTNQTWSCTEKPCETKCKVIGDPHYTTFDGKKYDFMGRCTYYLVKSRKFSIEAETVACSGYNFIDHNAPPSLPSCTRSVTIRTKKREVIILEQKHNVVVNGKKVKMPYQIGNTVIKMISSIFLEVTLPNEMKILWDGLTKVEIYIPSDFEEETKGLCGTYNKNQTDDFLTPHGIIETSPIRFGNSWKTNKQCGDLPTIPQPHPCNNDVPNKKRAEQQCHIIKSDVFSKCHKNVDPEPYYQDCVYDTCSCGQDYSKCLCTTVAAYADECSRHSIKIDWRKEKEECQLQCPSGQKYQICGNSCTRTCSDISERPNCKSQCVDGCNCPEGQALDENDKCVPICKCKCYYDGLLFPPGFKEIRPGTRGQELCTCVKGIWRCRPVTKDDTTKTIQDRCKSSLNMEFSKCIVTKPVACKNIHDGNGFTTTPCHAGCKCKDGYVLDTSSRNCVKPAECPCYYCGHVYEENEIVESSTFNCRCQAEVWECKFSTSGCYADWRCLLKDFNVQFE